MFLSVEPLWSASGFASGRVLKLLLMMGVLLGASGSVWAQGTGSGYTGQAIDPTRPVTVRIVSPLSGEMVPYNTVDAFFSVTNYALATGGNRLHVLLNNESPLPLDNIRRPVTFRNLPEGGHCIRVVAMTPQGSLVPDAEAFAMVHFFVRKRDFQNFVNPELPFLTVASPPSGVVEPDEQGRVWLDFRAHNATVGPNGSHVVRYEVNNVAGTLNGPFFWPGMKAGRYSLKVELLTPDLQPVPGPMNRVERVFDVRPALRALPSAPIGNAPSNGGTTLPGTLME